MANFISILSSFVADAVWCCAVVAALSLGCAVVWKWQDLAEGLKGEPKTFRAVFVAMLVVAATLFSKVDPNGAPPNLNAPLSGPVPTLQVGSPDDFADDVAKFAAINWTTNGVDLVLHRPESRATEAVEVTLVGSTNLVTATWEPFTNVVFAVGETNIALRVDRAALDDHSVSNICFFVFINSGDADEDGLPNWHERFNLKTDPYEVDTDEDGLTDGEELVFGVNPSAADSDGDGLNDWDEFVVGSDPLEVDTDGDGLSDSEEVDLGTDPVEADTDGDGLPDAEEGDYNADPLSFDTDGDGADDGWEVENDSDPSIPDTDGDGLDDGDECFLGSDPTLLDTDGDGISDADEVVFCTDPALADTDGDGLDDWEEIDCVREVGTNDWHLVSQSTTVFVRPAAGTVVDDEIQTVVLPNVVTLDGVEYDRASIDVNGKFHLIPTGGESVAVSDPDNLAPDDLGPGAGDLVVAPFWDDLEMRPTLSSEIKIGVEAATGWLIVQYLNLHVAAGDEADKVVSFQVAIAPGDEFPVRVTYRLGLAHGQLGAGATVGVFDRGRSGGGGAEACRSLVWSCDESGSVWQYLSIGFHFGAGTDPLDPDADSDGLLDGDEIDIGTDPLDPDTDEDGLPDGDEIDFGANPFLFDTDEDGLPDGWEVAYGLMPNYYYDRGGDPDRDGLTNIEEFQCGSLPNTPDTDGDTVLDGDEVRAGTDPANPDTDGDGLDDAYELAAGLMADYEDTDYDGMSDGWEVDHGLDPEDSADADNDEDLDGLDNAREYALGTDPSDSDTDGDGLSDVDEAGGYWCAAFADQWASTASGWSPVAVTEQDDGIRFVFAEALTVSGETAVDVLCRANGILCLDTAAHSRSSTWSTETPVPLEGGGPAVTGSALVVAPFWITWRAGLAPTISVFRRLLGSVVEYAVRCDGLAASTTEMISWQTVFRFEDGRLRRVETAYSGDGLGAGVASHACIGVRDNILGEVCQCGFFDWFGLHSDRSRRYVPSLGTDPVKEDTDGDGISDGTEIANGMDPCQPDTDGDGMDDGWEFHHGFDPRINNAETFRTDDDATADPDGDGLTNAEECAFGTNPSGVDANGDGVPDGRDTDGDGVADGAEIAQNSDPTNAADDGRPGRCVPIKLYFGDQSSSHSEKYRVELKPVQGPPDVPLPPTVSRLNQNYGECESQTVFLKRGWKYEVRLFHVGTAPQYTGMPRPDYDYTLRLGDGTETYEVPVNVRLEDPKKLFGVDDTSESFGGNGKVAYLTVFAFSLEVVSDELADYDVCYPGTLIDSRTATIRAKVFPEQTDHSSFKFSISCRPTEVGELVNDGHGTDVKLKMTGTDTWRSSKIYWYGVLPDQECKSCRNAYTFTLMQDQKTVCSIDCPVLFPDEVARAEWPSPRTNATTNSAPVHVQTATENYWYCDILFHEFEKEEGRVVVVRESLGVLSTDFVEWTGQYKQKILKEERFHLKQLRGEVPGDMGGQGDCFTVKGIKYFIARQARNNRDIDVVTWRVRGNSAQAAEENAQGVIKNAINNEIEESNKIMLLDKGFVELTAKAHVGYNAAFRYHCTYQNVYGENPVNHVHPAYQNGQNEEEEQ